MSTQQPEAPKTPGSRFYVSVIRHSGLKPDWRAIVGPFVQHENALAVVDRARVEAEKVDPRASWYAFGTIQITPDGTFEMPVGKLNYAFTAELEADALTREAKAVAA